MYQAYIAWSWRDRHTTILEVSAAAYLYPSIKSLKLAPYEKALLLRASNPATLVEELASHVFLLIRVESQTFQLWMSTLYWSYHNKLEHIELKVDLDTNERTIYTIQYPHLKTLHLDSTAWWIPRNAPMLQWLTKTSRAINSNSAVLDTIPPNLKKLELLLEDLLIHSKAALVRYFNQLAQQSQLKELDAYFSSLDDVGSVLDAICSLSSASTPDEKDLFRIGILR